MLQRFEISDQSTPEQRRVFENINAVLDMFNISADDFDRVFRIRLMNSCLIALNYSGTPHPILSGFVHKLNATLGRFQDVDPMVLFPKHRTLYDSFQSKMPSGVRSLRGRELYFNILQNYAAGSTLISKEKDKEWDYQGEKMIVSNISHYVATDLIMAIRDLPEVKPLPQEQWPYFARNYDGFIDDMVRVGFKEKNAIIQNTDFQLPLEYRAFTLDQPEFFPPGFNTEGWDQDVEYLARQKGVRFALDPENTQREIWPAGNRNKPRIIFIDPKLLLSPNAKGLIIDRVKAASMHDSGHDTVPKQLTQARAEETSILEDDIPSSWQYPLEDGRSLTVPDDKIETPKLRDKFPISYLAWTRFKNDIKAEIADLRGEPLDVPATVETEFTINSNVLTAPQQAYFGQLNRIIGMLGVTSTSFDQHYRLYANQQKMVVASQQYALLENAQYDAMLAQHGLREAITNHIHAQRDGEALEDFILFPSNIDDIRLAAVTALGAFPKSRKNQNYSTSFNQALRELHDIIFLGVGNDDLNIDDFMPHERTIKELCENYRKILSKPYSFLTSHVYPVDSLFLQTYTSGQTPFALLKSGAPFDLIGQSRKVVCPDITEMFSAAIHNAVLFLAEKQDLDADAKRILRAELIVLEGLEANAYLWPDELEERDVRLKKEAEAETQRLRLIAEEGQKPASYAIDQNNQVYARIARNAGRAERKEWETIRADNVDAREAARREMLGAQHARQDIDVVAAELNAKLADHRILGDVLFSEASLRRMEYVCVTGNGKIPKQDTADRAAAAKTLADFHSLTEDDLPEQHKDRYLLVRAAILASPTILVSLLGTDEELGQLRDINAGLMTNAAVLEESEASIRMARAVLNRVKGIESVLEASIDHTPDVVVIVNNGIPVAGVIIPPENVPAKFTSVIAAGDAPKLSLPGPIYTEMELQQRAGLRAEALEVAKLYLQADAEAIAIQAVDQGCRLFECFLDLKIPSLPIRLHFSNGNGRKYNTVLDDYGDSFHERGLTYTLEDAVDLKMAVQSCVLNHSSIDPAYNISGMSHRKIGSHIALPHYAYEPDLRETKITERSNGVYVLEITIEDVYDRSPEPRNITIGVPLGLASIDKNEAEIAERDWRAQLVLNLLNQAGQNKEWRTKDDIEYALRQATDSWVEGRWIKLSGFEDDLKLYVGEGDNSRKITLSSVRLGMDIGGDNPSWNMCFDFYEGDNNDSARGRQIRSRFVNLHTRDESLAKARAIESLSGVKFPSGEQMVQGFLPNLQAYLYQNPDARWQEISRVEGGRPEVFVGSEPLQHFLDDMMRYEKDVGVGVVQVTNADVRECITTTLRLQRTMTGDYGQTVTAVPEPLRESIGDGRQFIDLSVTLPTDNRQEVEVFVGKVQHDLRLALDEIYASEDPYKGYRKRPQKYHTATARNGFRRAVEKAYEAQFGAQLSRNWYMPVRSEQSAGAQPEPGL